ncbi:helix-turn-helix domain-containing protein [Rhizobium laguerreae]|uniref:helix-turn-helix domain-containing protein n=1 Tax=Rhizobium laguerreae TaxID=1076926 RepID=UPI0021B0D1CD|nr:helix-turn-helix domain-containing protein [Rhizobium laguerreae]
MSERDLQRIEVLSKVVDGRATLVSAAHVLDLSTRQVRRLLDRIRTSGLDALALPRAKSDFTDIRAGQA